MKIGVIGGGPGGLYFALLIKKHQPQHDVHVLERNRPGETFGWGVVFSDETLGNFLDADAPTHERIREEFVHWDAIDTLFKGEVVRSGGHGFSGVARRRLLQIMQDRCAELGVKMHFEVEVDGIEVFADADLIVAADGINSKTRTALAEHFRPDIEVGTAKFIWLGTRKVFDAFKFFIRDTPHGLFQVHAYPFDAETSTFIVECDEEAFRGAGRDVGRGVGDVVGAAVRRRSRRRDAHDQPLVVDQLSAGQERDLVPRQRGAHRRRRPHGALLDRLGHQARHGGRDRAVSGGHRTR